MVRAWMLDSSEAGQRLPNMGEPPQFVDVTSFTKRCGVKCFKIDVDNFETCEVLNNLKRDQDYTFEDDICIDENVPDREEMLMGFYGEHLHDYDEAALITEGSGYFDFRTEKGEWVRVEVSPGDFIILPAGIFHRFTLDTKDYIKARRYRSKPADLDWNAHYKPEAQSLPIRCQYEKTFLA